MIWLLIAVAVVVVFAVYLSATAGRLDRLHHRVETGAAALDAQLLARSGAILAIATSGLLDPATSLILADDAAATREDGVSGAERQQRESDLTRAMAATFGTREDIEGLTQTSAGSELVDELAGAVHRSAMSRRFYNDSVRACRAVRRQRLVRWLRLAGHAPLPRTVEMDDTVPTGLTRR